MNHVYFYKYFFKVNGHSDSMRGVLATKDNAVASLEALYRGRGVGRGKPQDTTSR